MRILVTNDDGIFAEGIRLLAEAAAGLGEVVVVAPDREQSASGHSLTLHRPLRMREVREHWYAVDGTPTDCVNLALQGLLREKPPDLVVSGINYGPNMGDDVTYSGTVSAAFEANLNRIPAVAFSQQTGDDLSLERSAGLALELLASLLAWKFAPGGAAASGNGESPGRLRSGLPSDLLLNVNFPPGPARGLRLTRLGRRFYRQTVVEKLDPKGRKYFWIAGTPEWEREHGTDHDAVTAGFVSVTPLHLDLTDYGALERYEPLAASLGRFGRRAAASAETD